MLGLCTVFFTKSLSWLRFLRLANRFVLERAFSRVPTRWRGSLLPSGTEGRVTFTATVQLGEVGVDSRSGRKQEKRPLPSTGVRRWSIAETENMLFSYFGEDTSGWGVGV